MQQVMTITFKVYDKQEEQYTTTDWSGREIFLTQDGFLTTGVVVDGILQKCDPERYIYKFEMHQIISEENSSTSTFVRE